MNFKADFNDLSGSERQSARRLLRNTFGDILTELLDCGEEVQFTIQMEAISSEASKILNQRIRFNHFVADKLVSGKKLVVVEVEFVRHSRTPELGVFHEMTLFDDELWKVGQALEKTRQGSCQILRMDEAVKQVMKIPDFRPYLPKKLQDLDFNLIGKRSAGSMPPKRSHLKKGLLDSEA